MIRLANVTKVYTNQGKQFTAIKDVCLTVKKGQLCSVIGPSGCGKTTLLYILAGIIRDYQGSVLNAAGKESSALILQDYGLLPWKTVWQNVTLGLEIRKKTKKEIKDRGEEGLSRVGLLHLKDLYPSQLSGGQRQRVALARALAMQAELVLMDEPFSALDAITREELQDTFLKLWNKFKMTAVLVTHSIEEAVYLGNRIIVMSPSPGRIIYQMDNPLQGDIHARNHSNFFATCSDLRQRLKIIGK